MITGRSRRVGDERSGHLPGFPLSGRTVVLPLTSAHDEPVPVVIASPRSEPTGNLCPDLERFWPSRRGHAYDEFCR